MDLALDETQASILELFSTFFERECPPEVLHASETTGWWSPDLWQRLVQTGAPGLGVAEASGGAGLGLLALINAVEPMGRWCAPVPLVDHLVASRLVDRAGGSSPLLARLVAGDLVAALALPGTTLVGAGAAADVVVGPAGDGSLVAVEAPPPPALANLGRLPLAERPVDVSVGRRQVLAGPADGRALYEHALDEWRVLVAAVLVGVASGALDEVVAYVKERHQFGVPIGSFQAIQHGLAELPGPIGGARMLVQKAAWEHDAGATGAPVRAAMALSFAGRVAEQTLDRAVHYQGGYGVMEESRLAPAYRWAKAWRLLAGDPRAELRRLGALLATTSGEVA